MTIGATSGPSCSKGSSRWNMLPADTTFVLCTFWNKPGSLYAKIQFHVKAKQKNAHGVRQCDDAMHVKSDSSIVIFFFACRGAFQFFCFSMKHFSDIAFSGVSWNIP
jgi:hypothetical protein